MQFRSESVAFVCLGGACLAAFLSLRLSLEHRAPEAPSPAPVSAAPVTARPERSDVPQEVRAAVTPEPQPVPDEAEERLRRRMEAAEQVISVPPPGQRPSLSEPQSLPPQVEAQRQSALLDWKQATQRLLDSCTGRPRELRRPVALQVGFAPRPGDTGLTFTPDWISIPPPELQRLWKDTDPEKLQACLDRARTLPLEVTVPGDLPARDAPHFAESVLVQL